MKSYVVMADNREKIICVSDDLRLARGAGWDWQDILEDMDYESENDLRHDMLLGACWEDFDMEIIEVERARLLLALSNKKNESNWHCAPH